MGGGRVLPLTGVLKGLLSPSFLFQFCPVSPLKQSSSRHFALEFCPDSCHPPKGSFCYNVPGTLTPPDKGPGQALRKLSSPTSALFSQFSFPALLFTAWGSCLLKSMCFLSSFLLGLQNYNSEIVDKVIYLKATPINVTMSDIRLNHFLIGMFL